jgi:hypothetical protein
VSPVAVLIFAEVVAGGPPATAAAAAAPPPAPLPDAACASRDARDIVVCGQRRQSFRLDPSVVEGERQAESDSRSATSAMPSAQAACAASKMGCTKDLRSLDLANVGLVAATTAIRAARGEDWAKAFKPGGPDEYQLYRQAKRRHEAEAEERAAIEVRRKAEAQELQVHAAADSIARDGTPR